MVVGTEPCFNHSDTPVSAEITRQKSKGRDKRRDRERDDVVPEELGADRAGLDNAARESLVLHQWRRVGQSVLLDELARDAGRHAGAVWWNEEPHTGVTTATHRSTARVHHETYQKTANTRHTM